MSGHHDADKKQMIKNAARELFFRFGFAKTGMADIARVSGLAKPTLYYYYASKEEIFNEILLAEAQQFIARAEAKLAADQQPDVLIAAFLRTIYQDLKDYAAETDQVPELLCKDYPHGQPIVARINLLFLEKVRPWLRAGKDDGLFNFDDEEATLAAIVCMIQFLNLDWMRQVPESLRDQIMEHVIQIILFGLKRRKE